MDESLWDEVVNLFAKDGWAEVPDAGIYIGRERIRRALEIRYASSGGAERPIRVHQVFQPVIHVAPDGKSAKIRARLLELGGTSGGDGSWTAGAYEDELVAEGDEWMFKTMDLDYTWSAPYRGGWARAAAEGLSPPQIPAIQQFPPDRPPRGASGLPFPKVHAVPFHYKNPVTGRAP